MDYFARQERSRRSTRLLLALYLVAVAAIVCAVTVLVVLALRLVGDPYRPIALDEPLVPGIALVTAGFILLASLFRMASLSQGGGQIARMLGGTALAGETSDPLRRRLLNVVEEMAIAAGTPVPELFVLEQEPGINAFAAGSAPANAAVAVTQGALERLERTELQGVIAHEFSHILNGDMRLNSRLLGLSFGILALSLLGRTLLRSARYRYRGARSRGAALVPVMGGVLILVGSIGLFFARLIKAGISRQRETLADASAVQFTRNPSGLAEALKKIGAHTGELSSRDCEEVAHMLFSTGAKAFSGWFATHPPLDERIRALDPSFVPGEYSAPRPAIHQPEAAEETRGASALGRVGEIAPPGLAAALLGALPAMLREAAESPEASRSMIVALALAPEPGVRARQATFLSQRLGKHRATDCLRLAETLENVDTRLKLPLVELSLPALRRQPPGEIEFLAELLHTLTGLNAEPRLFDYVLLLVLTSYFDDLPGPTLRHRKPRHLSLMTALVCVLRCVAAYGHRDGAAARAAFQAGMAAIAPAGRRIPPPDFSSLEAARDLEVLDDALAALAGVASSAKRRVLTAILACIRHDRRIDIAELELFRAIAAALGCPVPPDAALTADT